MSRAIQHQAEKVRVSSLPRNPLLELGKARQSHGRSIACGNGVRLVTVNESDARIRLSFECRLVAVVALAWTRAGATISKVVSAGDAVLQMIERTREREPVKIFRLGKARVLVIEAIDPSR